MTSYDRRKFGFLQQKLSNWNHSTSYHFNLSFSRRPLNSHPLLPLLHQSIKLIVINLRSISNPIKKEFTPNIQHFSKKDGQSCEWCWVIFSIYFKYLSNTNKLVINKLGWIYQLKCTSYTISRKRIYGFFEHFWEATRI